MGQVPRAGRPDAVQRGGAVGAAVRHRRRAVQQDRPVPQQERAVRGRAVAGAAAAADLVAGDGHPGQQPAARRVAAAEGRPHPRARLQDKRQPGQLIKFWKFVRRFLSSF